MTAAPTSYQALLLTGVGGVGKSTIADEIGKVLAATGAVIAVVDTDALAQFGPPPPALAPDERSAFYDGLKCRNLAAVWTNYQAAGARFIVVAGVIDSMSLRREYAGRLVGCTVQLVRLRAPIPTVRERLRARSGGPELDRHLTGLAEREAMFEAAAVEDFTVVNDRPPTEVAGEIVTRVGWPGRPN